MNPAENPVPEQPEGAVTFVPVPEEQLEERMLKRIAERPELLDELMSRIEGDDIVD